MISRFFLLFMGFSVAASSYGDTEVYGPGAQVPLKVPDRFRGYELRISGSNSYELGQDEVRVKVPPRVKTRVEIVDANGAIVSDTVARIDQNLLADARAKPFSMHFGLGKMYSSTPNSFRKMNVSNEHLLFNFGVSYLPGRFGVMADYSYADSGPLPFFYHSFFKQQYKVNAYKLGLITQFVPFSEVDGVFLKRIHVALGAGVQYATHTLRYSDYDKAMSQSVKTLSPFLVADVRWVFWRNNSLFLQHDYSVYRLAFSRFSYDKKIEMQQTMIGLRRGI